MPLLAIDPPIWLLDEPFASGMDPLGLTAFRRHAHQAAERGHTVIYTTQILEVAERFSDRVCVLHQGTVRAFGALDSLREPGEASDGILLRLLEQLRGEDR